MGALGGISGLGGLGGIGTTRLLRDRFTDANAMDLANHTPDYVINKAAWVRRVGTGTIDTNTAVLASAQPDIVAIEVLKPNHVIEVEITQGNNNRMGVVFRYATTTSFGFFESSGDAGAEAQLRYRDGVGYNTVDSAAFTWTGTQLIRIESYGDAIECFVDGVSIVSGTVTEANTATEVGMWGWIADTATWDNFHVWGAR